MARNEIVVTTTTDHAFSVLLDPYAYPHWVVGTKRIRAVDENWPDPGARFHHSVGIGPLATKDTTSVVSWQRPHTLRLEVRFRPLGTAQVAFRLSEAPDPSHTKIVLHEEPSTGPVMSLRGRALDAAVHARNWLSLRRLRRLAESPRSVPVPAP